ncbi:M81 family metallopeptidase [Holdemania massiliensis]|uniref:M81 family metallopeptidase n=1 Tax=Holdemania massiliensis TaxID=1468449 RepID=UPI001F0707B5|nr:M81 family metallopeptidase [Holdemania massiliensis]MCH1939625.1 M81 family metallopeptidase [Holdemania massiliensis]
MKVLIGQFVTESNANIPHLCELTDYDLAFGEDCIAKMQIRSVFERHGIELIPSIYANAGANGVVSASAFAYIESCFLKTVQEHRHEIDGIYLMLHGASEVQDLEGGSGDHHILLEIRKLVGPYVPIAVSCDPHGNLKKEYAEAIQILRSYRQSPHTDKEETYEKVTELLCQLLKQRQHIHAVYRKLPLILGGEQSVSADEPVRSINRYMDQLEEDPRILSCSWHVGYIRHDCAVAGCGIVVIPAHTEDQAYAEEIADQLADYVWQRRHEFHYTGLTAKPDEALKMALDYEGSPAVITDSGDNMTSGATGWNTFVLRQVLALPQLKKHFLFAPICDPKTVEQLKVCQPGEPVKICLGVGHDTLSERVELSVIVRKSGEIARFVGDELIKVFGQGILVSVQGKPIDILITNTSQPIIVNAQLQHLGIDWTGYEVTVVKQGYIFPDFKAQAGFYVMSLTDGATPQDTASIPFKRIMRPMFPIDQI